MYYFSELDGCYCVYYPSNIFCNTHGFENWINLDIPQFLVGNIQ